MLSINAFPAECAAVEPAAVARKAGGVPRAAAGLLPGGGAKAVCGAGCVDRIGSIR